jgi:hypothetical protein
MSPASYLTAPPRDVYINGSTVPHGRGPVSVRDVLLWIALVVLLVAVVGGLAYAALRGFQLFRTAKRSGAVLTAEMDRINAVSLEIERHMAEAEAAQARLGAATSRLAISRARLDVQLSALRQTRAEMRRVFWFVPGI